MRWIEKFDLFLFDLDGLLVDTERLHFEAYRALCAQYGHELNWSFEDYIQVAHTSYEGLEKAIHPHIEKGGSWDELYREKKALYLELLRQGQLALMPGVEALLKELASSSIKRCVATHSARELVETIKQKLPILKTIPVWITREDYVNPKPAPDAYLKAISLLAEPGDRIIGFEDSLRGVQALQGTPAQPILICPSDHPQMKGEVLEGIKHYPTLLHILNRIR